MGKNTQEVYSEFQEWLIEESHLMPLKRDFNIHKKLLHEDWGENI